MEVKYGTGNCIYCDGPGLRGCFYGRQICDAERPGDSKQSAEPVERLPAVDAVGVKYIKQYFNDISGEEKNRRAAELIMEVAKQAGVTITEEQARAIAQAAYEQMKAGEAAAGEKVNADA